MNADDKAGQARKGLLDSVKGKAKEVAGAVIGNDSLTTEGQLQQRQAQDRQEANTTSAVADAQSIRHGGQIGMACSFIVATPPPQAVSTRNGGYTH